MVSGATVVSSMKKLIYATCYKWVMPSERLFPEHFEVELVSILVSVVKAEFAFF